MINCMAVEICYQYQRKTIQHNIDSQKSCLRKFVSEKFCSRMRKTALWLVFENKVLGLEIRPNMVLKSEVWIEQNRMQKIIL